MALVAFCVWSASDFHRDGDNGEAFPGFLRACGRLAELPRMASAA